MKRNLLLCLLVCSAFGAASQEFGGNPPSLKFRQIDTDTARIIYPVGLDSQAQRVAGVVHYLARRQPVSLGGRIHKINIVLQNQTTIPNGYVGLAPFRSEFYMTPDRDNFSEGSIPWDVNLAVHEYRHVQQYNNFRNGLSKLAYYLFGEGGLALGINASVPDWFYEGDAVFQETLLTSQGRGRLPSFLNEYRSLWQAQKNYSWMKLRNGSLKDYVPSHYPLGYLLVNYGRKRYGMDFWSKVTHDASAYRGLFYPFQKALTRYSGVSFRRFREEALASYQSKGAIVPVHTTEENTTGIKTISPVDKAFVADYLFPYTMENGALLYLKRSYRHIPAFYIRDSTGEKKLRTRDIAADNQYGYRNGLIVYAAYEPDTRWGWRNYSVIRVLDVHTGKQRTLQHRTRYFTPDISADGGRIVVTEVLPSGENSLRILDAANGAVLRTIRAPEVMLFTDPKFAGPGDIISAARLKDGRMALARVGIESGVLEWLTPASYNVIGYPNVYDGTVYFTASVTGNDELYALQLKDKKIFRLTDTGLGNYYVNASGNNLTWSAFTADGYRLRQMRREGTLQEPVNPLAMQESMVAVPYTIAGEEAYADSTIAHAPPRVFPEKKYRTSDHLFYPHSWQPYYSDPDFYYSLYSDNILNTLSAELFYHYNRDDKTHGLGLNATYAQWFPHINRGIEFTMDRPARVNGNPTRINTLEAKIGLSVPLNFSRGRNYRFLNAGTDYVFNWRYFKGVYKDSLPTVQYNSIHHFLYWTQFIQSARQHIFPRLGYTVSLNYRYAASYYKGYQFAAAAALYLPGVVRIHNLVLTGGFQQRDTSRLLFGNLLASARGYSGYYGTNAGSRMWRVSANYHFPLWLPDWGFGNLLYVRRIRANIFYDKQRLYANDRLRTIDLASTGGEIYFDTRWWNQLPVTLGFRVSHLLNDDPLGGYGKGSNLYEFIVPVDLIPR